VTAVAQKSAILIFNDILTGGCLTGTNQEGGAGARDLRRARPGCGIWQMTRRA
jgi:hypothetical protein